MVAPAAATAAVSAASAARIIAARGFGGCRRRKGGKLLLQFAGSAMGTLGAGPLGRPDQDFAVLPALLTMKLVYWHARIIAAFATILNKGLTPPHALRPPTSAAPER